MNMSMFYSVAALCSITPYAETLGAIYISYWTRPGLKGHTMSTEKKTRPYIICLEGSIGSGKTSLLRSLSARLPNVEVFEERVEEFQEALENFYQDPSRHAFRLQVKVSLVHRDTQRRVLASDAPVVVVERSPLSNQWVFGHMLWNDSVLTDAEWKDLCHAHEHYQWQPDAYILLDTRADACYARKCLRDRNGEQAISIDYLLALEQAHDRVFKSSSPQQIHQIDGSPLSIPVIVIDGNSDSDTVVLHATEAIQKCSGNSHLA